MTRGTMVPGIKPHENARNLEPTADYDAEGVCTKEALALGSETDVYEDAGLSEKQWAAVAMLLAGRRQTDIAAELNLTQSTVSRWRHSPVFAAALNAAVRDSYLGVIGEVRDACTDALRILRESLEADDPRVRLTAARVILKLRLSLDASALTQATVPADIARESLRRRSMNELDDMLIDL